MNYNISKELKNLSKISGNVVGKIYPLINLINGLAKCKTDKLVSVKRYSTLGYKDAKLSILIIEPKHCTDKMPCIVLYHGGGLLMRASAAHYQLAKWYATKANCKVILPDYRLLPKYRYPVAIEDCYNTFVWVKENCEILSIDSKKIILAGDSAGGLIACAVAAMLKDRKQILPRGVMLIYPVLDNGMNTESMKRFVDTPIWDSNCNKLFWNLYLDGCDVNKAKYATISEKVSVASFPGTYIEVAEFDCLRDEGKAFAEKLQSQGVSVNCYEIKGTCHGYESALKSSIVSTCLTRRIEWINSVFNSE